MDIISLIIGMKLGGGGMPLGEASGEFNPNEIGLSWETSAEVDE